MTKKLLLNPLMVAALFALSFAGCRCGPITRANRGEARLLVDIGGANAESDTLDFGTVAIGKRVTGKINVSNVGGGVLQVEAWEKSGDGPPVQLGKTLTEASPVFGIPYEQVEIASGATLELDAFFEPPAAAALQVDYEVKLIFRASNTEPGKETTVFTLKGRGIKGECDLPDRLDFGAVARGDSFQLPVVLKNARPVETSPRVDPIVSMQGSGVFTTTPDSPRGEFAVAPNKEKTVTFVFTPTETRDYFATVRVKAGEGCPDKTIRLVGNGVDQVITWDPTLVDFGYVQPGLTVTQDITFLNQGFTDVVLARLSTQENNLASNTFKVTAADPNELTTLTVPKATRNAATTALVPGTAKLTVAFKPTVLGPRVGALVASPTLRAQNALSVPLRGFGGGPDIDLSPSGTINFGRVAFFTGANAFATRRVTVRNVGTRPTPADPAANLKLGRAGAKPYWRVTPRNPQSLASEICVGQFDATAGTCSNELPTSGMGVYDPFIGIEASGARASLDVPIRITPANTLVGASGDKEWDVTFFSNDPDEPEVTVTVTARPVLLPPCNYTVAPQALTYGVVTPPSSRDLTFQVCNQAPVSAPAQVCLVTNLDLEAGSDSIFSLPAGGLAERLLAPQECMTVVSRAWPTGLLPPNPTNVTGAVVFNVSDPSRPQGRVQLTATLAPSCLVISPNALDFGTVQQNCNSSARTFTVYNACSQEVRWVGAGLISGGGVPAGTPGCAGPGRCDEFKVTAAPSTAGLPTCSQGGQTGPCLSQGGTPVTFQLQYRPIDLGSDTGAYRIQVVQGGQQVDYVVTLQGKGDLDGSNTDVFRQDARPKADILLVIDDSCSMNDKQRKLAENFSAFVQFATTSQVDFQLGITTTDADDEGSCPNCITGDLRAAPAPHPGTKIFTPTTPNLEQQFAATVTVGTLGSSIETCMAPAVRALTAPKITDPTKNGGLLRPDAVLAVVCVTDAPDQSNQPVAFYLNQLQNIKGAQRPGAFTYNVIGPFLSSAPTGCVYDGSGDDGKHVQLVSQTGGVKEEVCALDWAPVLQNIGKKAFGFRTNFYLTGTPYLPAGPITIQIDGLAVPETDSRGSRVWRYEAASNSIIFEPLYVPEPGKTMTVSYKVACL